MTGFMEWLGRVIMLVLAGMITLSIIGAIASIPSGSIGTRIGMERQQWPVPQAEEQPRPARQQQRADAASPQAGPAARPTSRTIVAPAPPQPVDPARWLEAITYALLALAGIGAFATILLLRALGHWRRSADALEVLASRRSG